MPRPFRSRRVAGLPACELFKPAGVPGRELEIMELTVDEYEALRLADLEGWYQEACAAHMGVSRPTFGRILESAHRKIARVLHAGLALRIQGGCFRIGPAGMPGGPGRGPGWGRRGGRGFGRRWAGGRGPRREEEEANR